MAALILAAVPVRADFAVVLSEHLPSARDKTSAVWTGAEALVFGADGNSAGIDIVRYNPVSGTVTAGDTFPSSRSDTGAAWTGSVALLFGGWGGDDQILQYDPLNDAVTTKGETLPVDLFASSAVWDRAYQLAYVFGGRDAGVTGHPAQDSILVYNPVLDDIVRTDTLPAANAYTSAIMASNGNAYVFGGWEDNSIVRYNPTTQEATLLPVPLPDDVYLTSAVYDGSRYAYIFGGADGTSSSDKIFRFDTVLEVATLMAGTLPSARVGTSAVWGNGNAYVFGGRGDSVLLDDIVRYNPDAVVPATGVKTCDTYNAIYGDPYSGQDGVVVEVEPQGQPGDLAVCAGAVVGGPCPAGQPGVVVNNEPVCSFDPCPGPTNPGVLEACGIGPFCAAGVANADPETLGACGVGPFCPSGVAEGPGAGQLAAFCGTVLSACSLSDGGPGPGWTVGVNGDCAVEMPWVEQGAADPCPDNATLDVRVYWSLVSGGHFDVCL